MDITVDVYTQQAKRRKKQSALDVSVARNVSLLSFAA